MLGQGSTTDYTIHCLQQRFMESLRRGEYEGAEALRELASDLGVDETRIQTWELVVELEGMED